MRYQRSLVLLALVTLAIGALGLPSGLAAQTPSATPLEMRHFWHVFIAYAIAWVVLAGWLWSIVRRLRRTEERLSQMDRGSSSV